MVKGCAWEGRWLWFVLIVLACILGACKQKQTFSSTELTPLRISTSTYLGSAPIFVADDRGFFREEGLEIALDINQMGVESLRKLFDGDVDIASMAELPLVYSLFDKQKYTAQDRGDFLIFGDLVLTTNVSKILVRNDRGISRPEDLRGKTIAIPQNTSVDFLFDLFLVTHKMVPSDIRIVNLDVSSQVEAIVDGDVDAIFTWQPHVQLALNRLGDKGALLPLDLFYHNAWLVVTMRDYAEKHPDVLEKFLHALVKAEDFLHKNPQEAISIHARYTGVDRDIIAAVWPDVEFYLSLSEALLTTMEDEARWLIRNGWTSEEKVPNLLEYFDFEPIKKAKPEALMVIQ